MNGGEDVQRGVRPSTVVGVMRDQMQRNKAMITIGVEKDSHQDVV